MERLIIMIAGLSCLTIAGCKIQEQDNVNSLESDEFLHGTEKENTADNVCLKNTGQWAGYVCSANNNRQQHMVLIRGEVLPLDK